MYVSAYVDGQKAQIRVFVLFDEFIIIFIDYFIVFAGSLHRPTMFLRSMCVRSVSGSPSLSSSVSLALDSYSSGSKSESEESVSGSWGSSCRNFCKSSTLDSIYLILEKTYLNTSLHATI